MMALPALASRLFVRTAVAGNRDSFTGRPMISIGVKVDQHLFDRKTRELLGKDLNEATARAMTATVEGLRTYGSREMVRRFDRPKKFTVNSMSIRKAKSFDKPGPFAAVYFIDESYAPKGTPAGKYLYPVIAGTSRGHKGFEKALIRANIMHSSEYAVPGRGLKLDGYGNVPGSTIKQMLSQLKAGQADQWETARSREQKRGKTGRLRGARWFASDGSGELPRGIYRRTGRKVPDLVFAFVTDKPNYRKVYPFDQLMHNRLKQIAPYVFEATARKIIRGKYKRR